MHKKKVKEVIVVEGRDDISAVKRAVDAELIEVNGFAVRKKATLEKIKFAHEKNGVIVLTDPDYAGEKIRKTIEDYVPGVKHAYISRKEGTKVDNIGVENACSEAILAALEKAKYKLTETRDEFSIDDMTSYGLTWGNDAKKRRQELGSMLKIGYANAKQFLRKLNHFGITRDEFLSSIEKIEG